MKIKISVPFSESSFWHTESVPEMMEWGEENALCRGQNFWDLIYSFQLFTFHKSWDANVEIYIFMFWKQNIYADFFFVAIINYVYTFLP